MSHPLFIAAHRLFTIAPRLLTMVSCAVAWVGRKIGLLDHMGGGNLGDDATQTAVIYNIRKRWPDCKIYGFSMNPSDTQSRHGIPAYPIRAQTWNFGGQSTINNNKSFKQALKSTTGKYKTVFNILRTINKVAIRSPRTIFREIVFLIQSFRFIQSFDLLIISGGGQLLDLWGGPWKFPYTIFKWVMLAKLARVRCVVLNVGAGPVEHKLSKTFIRKALFLADYVSFRDNRSLALSRNIGFSGKANVFPDCVYGLDPASYPPKLNGCGCDSQVVGIAPMAYGDANVYPENDRAVYEHMIHNLGLFASWLVSNHYNLRLFCSDIGVDPSSIKDLAAHVPITEERPYEGAITIPALASGADLLLNVASMDYVITCRFHGVIFAHILNRPVLAISHHPKVVTLMNDLGLSEYCADIHSCDLNVLTEKFMSLVRNGQEIKQRMAERLACYQLELSKQFDELFPQDILSPC